MDHPEALLLLLIAAAALVRLADGARIPAPIVLVLGGLGIALVPGLPRIALPPDVIFLFFLPPLVYAAAWSTPPRELRAIVGPLSVLAVGLVLLTGAAVALVVHLVLPGLGWPAAAVLGAVLAPTDAVAASATFSRLGVPHGLKRLVEGESMINDGTALVLFRIAVGVAAGGTITAPEAVGDFLLNVVGGVGTGLVIGWVSDRVLRRQTDPALAVVLTLLSAYAAYLGAEELHASGILAAVVAGVWAGWHAPTSMDADTRLTAVSFWNVLVFGLEITLFVLLGLQLPVIVEQLASSPADVPELLAPSVLIALTTIVVRLAVVFALGRRAGGDARERLVAGWAGMRGAVSLAAALSIPLTIAERPQLVFMTFAVILLTLVGQGLSLPLLVRALKLPPARRWTDEEAVARMEAAQSALDRIDELEQEEPENSVLVEQLERLRGVYRRRFRVCMAVLDGQPRDAGDDMGPERRALSYGRLRRALIATERQTLLQLRSTGRLHDLTMRQIERDLDLEEARLRS